MFEATSKEIGENTLKSIGLRIPANAQFPPWVKDIDSASRAIDVAYHMNHRKKGAVLFDPGTGKMTEGTIVTHDTSKPCRKTGSESCTYVVSW